MQTLNSFKVPSEDIRQAIETSSEILSEEFARASVRRARIAISKLVPEIEEKQKKGKKTKKPEDIVLGSRSAFCGELGTIIRRYRSKPLRDAIELHRRSHRATFLVKALLSQIQEADDLLRELGDMVFDENNPLLILEITRKYLPPALAEKEDLSWEEILDLCLRWDDICKLITSIQEFCDIEPGRFDYIYRNLRPSHGETAKKQLKRLCTLLGNANLLDAHVSKALKKDLGITDPKITALMKSNSLFRDRVELPLTWEGVVEYLLSKIEPLMEQIRFCEQDKDDNYIPNFKPYGNVQ